MNATIEKSSDFPKALFDLRIARAMTQQDVADRMTAVSGLDWHASTISRLESGARDPSPESILTLADAFELDGLDRFRFFAAAGRWEESPTDDQLARIWAAIEREISEADAA